MALRSLALGLFCSVGVLAASLPVNLVDATTRPTKALLPSTDAARQNAFGVFNAVHSAMRQWGAAVKHNGMSAFFATIPEGQVFYHGGREPDRPTGFDGIPCEWLAFEVEHAFGFASHFGGPPPSKGDPPPNHHGPPSVGLSERLPADRTQKTLGGVEEDDDDKNPDPPSNDRSYFHTYRANRPLNILYLDGMSAGNSYFGTMDFQDGVLLDWPLDDSRVFEEWHRAADLCRVANEWAWDGGKIDGFIRTEAGFEIIYCDFSEGGGLDVVSINAAPFPDENKGISPFEEFEFLRGIAQRYHGLPAGRIHVDWSSMVSAFFYDVNLTNPDATRPELPRLVNTTHAERQGIRARVHEVVAAHAGRQGKDAAATASIDWQGIVDLVVTRSSSRLAQISQSEKPADTARGIVGILLDPLLNYPDDAAVDVPAEVLSRCTQHYLSAAAVRRSTWTPEDGALYAAVETVTETICSSLFELRAVLKEDSSKEAAEGTAKDEDESKTDKAARKIVTDLMDTLQWTTWRECDPCANPDELCLVAMFPWGSSADHFHPQCLRAGDLRGRNGYWMGKRHRRPGPPGPP